jgi:hypothetical protein
MDESQEAGDSLKRRQRAERERERRKKRKELAILHGNFQHVQGRVSGAHYLKTPSVLMKTRINSKEESVDPNTVHHGYQVCHEILS